MLSSLLLYLWSDTASFDAFLSSLPNSFVVVVVMVVAAAAAVVLFAVVCAVVVVTVVGAFVAVMVVGVEVVHFRYLRIFGTCFVWLECVLVIGSGFVVVIGGSSCFPCRLLGIEDQEFETVKFLRIVGAKREIGANKNTPV